MSWPIFDLPLPDLTKREKLLELAYLKRRCFKLSAELGIELDQERSATDLLDEGQKTRLCRLFMDQASDLITIHDAEGNYLFVSPNAKKFFGWDPEELVGRNTYEFFYEEDLIRVLGSHASRDSQEVGEATIRYRLGCKDGTWMWVETRSTSRIVGNGIKEIFCVTRDITQTKQTEERLELLATVDDLTGCLTRRASEAFLENIFDSGPFSAAILIFDIDRFKNVNDTYGHSAGDRVIERVAKAIQDSSRSQDMVGRWGGEEFLVGLQATTYQKAYDTAERIRLAVEHLDFPRIGKVTVSAGVAVADASSNWRSIFDVADERLYVAKNSGRNRTVGN